MTAATPPRRPPLNFTVTAPAAVELDEAELAVWLEVCVTVVSDTLVVTGTVIDELSGTVVVVAAEVTTEVAEVEATVSVVVSEEV